MATGHRSLSHARRSRLDESARPQLGHDGAADRGIRGAVRVTPAATAAASAVAQQLFRAVDRCWICGETALDRYHVCRFDLHEYAIQDPELDAYTGQTATLVRCRACGF